MREGGEGETKKRERVIIESVDSISRDGTDTPYM